MTPPATSGTGWTDRVIDGALGLVIFTAVFAYLAALPRNLAPADESYFLLEAKRVLAGEALYRDMFWFAMPVPHWIMALAFRLFGATIETGRLTMAALHGALAVLVLLTCRRLAVRRAIAVIPPVAHVALCHPAFPYATPHWFASLMMTAILFVAVGRGPRWPLVAGALSGLLASCYQQQGVAFAVAIAAIVVLDALASRRYGSPRPARKVLRDIGALVAGMGCVLLPVLVFMLLSAGPSPLVAQLIVHPLTGYHSFNHSDWGAVNLAAPLARYTQPVFLKYLPFVVGVGVARAIHKWVTRIDRRGLENLISLILVCGAAMLAIVYFPDFIHIAFIASVFLVMCAETVEAALRRIEAAAPWPRLWGRAAAGVMLCVLVLQLSSNMQRARREFPLSLETAFGRVEFATAEEIRLVEQVRAALLDTPSRELFVYPVYASLYLTAGATNPTPYSFFIPGFNSADQAAELLELLRVKRVPWIVLIPLFTKPDDPIVRYVEHEYRRVNADRGSACTLFRRREP